MVRDYKHNKKMGRVGSVKTKKNREGIGWKEIKWLVGLQETDRLFICII